MSTQETLPTIAYNMVWINKGNLGDPLLSPNILENLERVADYNPTTDMRFWIDSYRTSPQQATELSSALGSRYEVLDLQDICAYRQAPLFAQRGESDPWEGKHSLIWRQVDTARLLTLREGDYDQTFYADLDIANLVTRSHKVQSTLREHGMIVSGNLNGREAWYENQLFGFTKEKRNILELLYKETLQATSEKSENGYRTLVEFLRCHPEMSFSGIDRKAITFNPIFHWEFLQKIMGSLEENSAA